MLYKESVTSETLDLLKSLSEEDLLSDFFLVEGTSLALQIGHRKSIDLDFFSSSGFDSDQIKNVEGFRLADPKDIAAMKLNAVCNRGSKKDFVNIFYLMQYYELQQLINFYQEKYKQSHSIMVLKSLLYYDDAEHEPDPIYLQDSLQWDQVKSKITTESKKLF